MDKLDRAFLSLKCARMLGFQALFVNRSRLAFSLLTIRRMESCFIPSFLSAAHGVNPYPDDGEY